MSTPPHDPTPPEGTGAAGTPPEGEQPRCPRCGAPHDPLQEYCLECGLRLVPLPRARFASRTVWSRESPVWLWIALGALLLVALAAGAIVALAATDDESDAGGGVSSLDDTATGFPTGPATSTITIETITTPSTLTLPTTTGTTTGSTTTGSTSTMGTTTTSGSIMSWPAGEDGYTVVLRSTPTSQGRGPADTAAREAIADGLPQVGVLNSGDYSSLNPGFYVTFTGVYDTQSQAANALPNARSKGFSTAYVRRVAN